MSQKSLETYRRRYVRAGRGWKTRILDEVCEMEGWSRKHTIKVMRGKVRRHAKPRCGRKAVYGQSEARMLEKLWLLMDQPCGKLMQAGLPEWLTSWERCHEDCPPQLQAKLLRISAAQIDRLLAPVKLRHPRKWRGGGGSVHLQNQIPVRIGPPFTAPSVSCLFEATRMTSPGTPAMLLVSLPHRRTQNRNLLFLFPCSLMLFATALRAEDTHLILRPAA